MDFRPETFGALYADGYDARNDPGTTEESVALISDLAGPDARMLELAIGTGRVALPLAATGLRVDGIDLSAAMLDRLRAKPGGDALRVTHGDMASVELPDRYRLVDIVFNSLMNLLTQDEQVAGVANAARHLTDDGVFVVEVVVPDAMYGLRQRAGVDQFADAERVDDDGVTLDVGRFDRASQVVDKSHLRIGAGGISHGRIALRYVWPSELDLMARLAGLRLRERRAGWDGGQFDGRSLRHVSVYGR